MVSGKKISFPRIMQPRPFPLPKNSRLATLAALSSLEECCDDYPWALLGFGGNWTWEFWGRKRGRHFTRQFPTRKKKVETSTLPFPCIFVLESGQGFADSDSKLGHQESAKWIFLIEWCFYYKGANHFEQSSFFNEPATSRPKIKQLHWATIHLLDIMHKGSPFWLP